MFCSPARLSELAVFCAVILLQKCVQHRVNVKYFILFFLNFDLE